MVGHVRIGHKQKICLVVYILKVWFQVGPSRTTGPVCLGCCLPVSGEVRCDGCQWPVNTPQQSWFCRNCCWSADCLWLFIVAYLSEQVCSSTCPGIGTLHSPLECSTVSSHFTFTFHYFIIHRGSVSAVPVLVRPHNNTVRLPRRAQRFQISSRLARLTRGSCPSASSSCPPTLPDSLMA